MHIPASTYRVQLHKDFTLRHLEGIVDYLHRLGITTVYAAPIVQATPGSMHGYDVTDPHTLNPELGTPEDMARLSAKLKENNMFWLQDIVPNHMAFNTGNFRLMDVLERGEESPYYHYFDIDWQHPAPHLNGKLQVPFLGSEPEACISKAEITLSFSEKGFTVDYFDTAYPLSLSAYSMLAASAPGIFDAEALARKAGELRDYQAWKKYKDTFMAALAGDEKKYLAILEALEIFHGDKEKMLALLGAQHYVLAWWKDTNREINYRRFFTVNELICLRMENEAVFDEYHAYLHDLYRRQVIHGVRIDHIDGLRDPGGYISRLRQRFGDDCYIIAEKILEAKEDMPAQWPLQGTSGYEFLAFVNKLITSRKGARQLVSFYDSLVPGLPPYQELVMANKRMILEQYMAGEWDNLLHYLQSLGLGQGFAADRLKQALGWLMVSLPVYRLYPGSVPLRGEALSIMNEAFRKAQVNGAAAGVVCKAELEYLRALFTEPQNAPACANILSFLGRLMQFTGPLTAKGVEDTTFYVYNALLSHDEVGDAPAVLGMTVAAFHNKMGERQHQTPLSLNATATHDTKRGEDARLRLNVLCEFPHLWQQHVARWLDINRSFRRRTSKGIIAPVVNDEYYIYQSVLGGFPEDLVVTAEFVERIQQYQIKVLREAKVHSDWADPDEEYETVCRTFISNILRPGSDFLESFIPLAEQVSDRTVKYALTQTLIKITAPGIPDIYQGCELWDLSFVDPDNRRPVDYAKRMEYLDKLMQKEQEGASVLFTFMEDHRRQGIEKLFVTWKALSFRKLHPHLFTGGAYLPLQVAGKDVVAIAYARHYQGQWAVVIAPVSTEGAAPEVGYEADVMLPPQAPSRWRNVLTGDELTADGRLSLSECLTRLPVALLVGG